MKKTFLFKFHFHLIFIYLNAECSNVPPSSNPASGPGPPPPHRGAAPQMYGSGSLRAPGTKPFHHSPPNDPKSTDRPIDLQTNRRIIIPPPPPPAPIIPHYTVLTHSDYLPSGYPVYFDPIVGRRRPQQPSVAQYDRPLNRGGMYGGRLEYPNGKPYRGRGGLGVNGYNRFGYPYDWRVLGMMENRGWAKMPNGGGYGSGGGYGGGGGYGPRRRLDETGMIDFDGKAKIMDGLRYDERDMGTGDEDEQDEDEDEGGHHHVNRQQTTCGDDCLDGQFHCKLSCMCIDAKHRCDGDMDCENAEDEEDCENKLLKTKCDENDTNFIKCPHTHLCIRKDWLCDGDNDCGDFFDETHCGYSTECKLDQFQCNNGLCILRTWVCDNDDDCLDFSDEFNCTKNGCTDDEFECGDETCISLSWKCDNQVDCSDGSDENNCETAPIYCREDEFQCATNKCIKLEFKCDGDDDCNDWSDENDCPKPLQGCVAGEFKCNNGKCIPERYRCDKQYDCEENEDEKNCEHSITATCTTDEHTCEDGICILKTWVCDGYNDCTNGEDESQCEIICDETKFPCLDNDNVTTAFCINRKYVCDGLTNCMNGEDELNCPQKHDCDRQTKCNQLCIITSDGIDGCACLAGYKLNSDGHTCEDIDECLYATDPVCSQTCNNTVGSFSCGCMTGYVLRPDLRTCKALGASPTLLFANRIDIRQVSLSNSKYTSILKGLHNAIALDYHYEKGLIFWSDVTTDVIRRATINGTNITDVIKWGLQSPGGVALDWIHNLLFWTDSGTRRIQVATLDGKQSAIIVADDIDKPRAIVVHPGEALIFWTDWGPNPKIERTEMDGQHRQNIITESVFWPNGLTIDYTMARIYWADAKHNVIESSRFDGSERRKVISKGLPHPFALTIFEDAIYWTDWHTKSISTANKISGAGMKSIHTNLHFPMDIHSYHPQRQPKYPDKCAKHDCAHMCLPNANGHTCVCRMGQKLNHDQSTCQNPEKLLLFARKKDLRLKHLDLATNGHEMVIPVDLVKSAVAIAWDARTDFIFWTDVEFDTINRAYWNGSNQSVLIHTNLVSPAGLAFDWLTEKIYWTDAGQSRIEVAEMDGQKRCLLIWDNLDKPRDIVVDPINGVMYWSDWGDTPKIEKSAMDGTMRQIIIANNLTWPNGLAIDFVGKKLYWADGGTKSIESSRFDGTMRQIILEGSSIPHPFGLDVYENDIYWTDWHTLNIERANKITGGNRTIIATRISDLMDVRIFHRKRNYLRTECNSNNGGCTDLCLLKPQSFACACPTGIALLDDGRTCEKAPRNYLIVAHRIDIRQISLDVPYLTDQILPIKQLKKATAIDVDRSNGDIYWSDTIEYTIRKSRPDGTRNRIVIANQITASDGLAIDSIGRKIYWTDRDRSSIEVAELNGSNRRLLFAKNLTNPRAITLHYELGTMYWSDWGDSGKIESAHMDGSSRKILIEKNLIWPNGLAIDTIDQKLYWNDAKLQVIESSDLDGSHRQIILNNLPHPYGLVVVDNFIYWSDWKTKSLHRSNKYDPNDKLVIRDNLDGLMDVRMVKSDKHSKNYCGPNNGNCSHLCLRNPKNYTCACPTGVKMLKNSSKICEKYPKTFLLIASRFTLTRISLDTPELWDDTILSQNANSNIIDVDFHWGKKLIFYTDIGLNHIKTLQMDNPNIQNTIIKTNLSSPNGIAIDWLANNIYWTNTGFKLIEVARLDGTYRKILVKSGLFDPRSIVVHPKKGLLFWTDCGEPKIERAHLDGTSRKVIVGARLSFPIGLVIDYKQNRLYWIDGVLHNSKIETCNLHGNNRIILAIQSTHPYSLAQFEDYIYWTDWVDKTVRRTDKTVGKNVRVIRNHLDASMGMTMVSEKRQAGWNPCAQNNGGCAYLCFYKSKNYTCDCPDYAQFKCDKEPKILVTNKCPMDYNCEDDEDEDEDDVDLFDSQNGGNDDKSMEHSDKQSNKFYIMTLVPMLCIIIVCIILVIILLIKKGKKKYLYANGRSFSNPNYYTNNEQNVNNIDKKQFIWKRLKYDKSQERVYEETTGTNSPEIASLIPTILTPCSSNCEAITPEMERSPTVTPLHKTEMQTAT